MNSLPNPPSLDALIDTTPGERLSKGGFLAPAPLPPDAPLSERERYRHASRSRHILIVAIGLAAAAYPIAFAHGGFDGGLVLALSISIGALLLAMYFNSRMRTKLAGYLAVGVMNVALLSQVVSHTPHQFDAYTLTIFCLFIQPELVALSMLGWKSIFPVVGLNIAFITGCALVLPASPEVAVLLGDPWSWYDVWLRIITVHIFIAFVMYRWVQSEAQALRRADRAAEVAKLQQTIAQTEHQRAEEQRHLQQGVEVISQVHARLANGDLNARVPFLTQPALQALGGKLNILLIRYQRALAEVQHVVSVQTALHALIVHVEHKDHPPFPLPHTHTILDPFIFALNHAWHERKERPKPARFSLTHEQNNA